MQNVKPWAQFDPSRPPSIVRTVRALLGFKREGMTSFVGEPLRPFKPRGLLLWGELRGVGLTMAVHNYHHLVKVSFEPVPARFFATGDSYEQIAKKMDAGAEPPAWVDWNAVAPGEYIRLYFDGLSSALASVELCMWGDAASI